MHLLQACVPVFERVAPQFDVCVNVSQVQYPFLDGVQLVEVFE
ncbi:MAG: hypothetical protein AAF197_10810 [Pseudomonadota bacterium]